MTPRIQMAALGGLTALLILVVGWQAQRVRTLDRRVSQLETKLEKASDVVRARRQRGGGGHAGAMRHEPEQRRGRRADRRERARERGAGGGGGVLDKLDARNPEVADQIRELVAEERERAHEERANRWRTRMKDHMQDELDLVAADHRIGQQQVDQVSVLLDRYTEERHLIWRKMHDDEMGVTDAKAESRALWDDDVRPQLVQLMGEPATADLEERMPKRGH